MSTSAANGGHTSAVKAVKFISSTRVVSSSSDRTVRIWNYSETDDAHDAHLSPVLELYGHKSSVDSLAVHAPSSRILSGSADHSICFWSVGKLDAPAPSEDLLPLALPNNKRRKLSNASKSVPQRGPLLQLTGHSNPVSSVIFAPNDPTVAYSTSWDHSVRTWDLPTGTSVDTRNTSHPLLSLCAMNGVNLLAAGSSARHITMVDTRTSATTVAAMTLRGHTNAVVSLFAHPTSAYGLVSASHDGTCRIWDLRSVKQATSIGFDMGGQVGESVYVIDREILKSGEKARPVAGDGVKVFEVVWDQQVGIVSAGEDKQLQINRTGR
jgi:WD40 repeat protein